MPGRRGQSVLEYTMIIGIVTLVLFYMGTGLKRGVQSMVKITADQVGNQQNSDQDYGSAQGFMLSANTVINENKNTGEQDTGYVPAGGNAAVYIINRYAQDTNATESTAVTNGGFSQITQ